jgi:hypothetical protein
MEKLQALLDAAQDMKENGWAGTPTDLALAKAADEVKQEFAAELAGDAILVGWSVEDLTDEIAPGVESLPEVEKRAILATAERRHDANVGINHAVLGDHASSHLHDLNVAAVEAGEVPED